MKANEFIIESEELAEYLVLDRHDPSWMIKRGNHPIMKKLNIIQTPLADYNVRYFKAKHSNIHDYFLYDKKTDRCVGTFSLEEEDDFPRAVTRLLAPGVETVTPHMGLAVKAQRQGISTLAYSTFLMGGKWVFITQEHTLGASKLWDSLAKGDIVSFYVDPKGRILDKPTHDSYRLLGPRNRFKST